MKGSDLLCLAWRLACVPGEPGQCLSLRRSVGEWPTRIGADVVHCVQPGGKRLTEPNGALMPEASLKE